MNARWAAALILCALLALSAQAKDPGWIDPQPILDLAGDDDTIVEVNIPGSLLNPICEGFRKENPELGDLVCGLRSIRAVILEFEADGKAARARDYFEDVGKRLNRDGWERLVRIRDGSETINVFTLQKGEMVEGLVVMIAGEGEVVFTNLVGSIDLEALSALGAMSIPGLEGLDLEDLQEMSEKP